MKRTLPLAVAAMVALTLGLAGAAQARHGEGGPWKQGTPVVIFGQVTSSPHKVLGHVERHFQISLGPGKDDTYTLHATGAQITGPDREKLRTSDLGDKTWVRAEGIIMSDPHRIKVGRMEVVGRDIESVKKSPYYRTEFGQGYIEELKPAHQ